MKGSGTEFRARLVFMPSEALRRLLCPRPTVYLPDLEPGRVHATRHGHLVAVRLSTWVAMPAGLVHGGQKGRVKRFDTALLCEVVGI